jgi:2C-methyl-D-erythritol 2,4-cyclodiphosphate synthase
MNDIEKEFDKHWNSVKEISHKLNNELDTSDYCKIKSSFNTGYKLGEQEARKQTLKEVIEIINKKQIRLINTEGLVFASHKFRVSVPTIKKHLAELTEEIKKLSEE